MDYSVFDSLEYICSNCLGFMSHISTNISTNFVSNVDVGIFSTKNNLDFPFVFLWGNIAQETMCAGFDKNGNRIIFSTENDDGYKIFKIYHNILMERKNKLKAESKGMKMLHCYFCLQIPTIRPIYIGPDAIRSLCHNCIASMAAMLPHHSKKVLINPIILKGK